MTIKDIFIETKRTLSTYGLTKGAMARDKKGMVCSPNSPDVDRLCFSGAMERVVIQYTLERKLWRRATYILEHEILLPKGFISVNHFNDHINTTLDDVQGALDEGIDLVITYEKIGRELPKSAMQSYKESIE